MSTIFFLKSIFEQKFIALHLNESCLLGESCLFLLYLLGESCLLCFLGVLRYLNKACVFFFVQKHLNKKIIINCPDNLNTYTTDGGLLRNK